MLKVDKPRDTRALQVSVTLPDAGRAQAVAQYIAEGTVELSRSGGKEADEALIADADKEAETMKVRLNDAENAWQVAAAAHSIEELQSEVSNDSYLKSRAEEQLLDEQSDIAGVKKDQPEEGRRDAEASRARAELLQKRIAELARTMDLKGAVLAQQTVREENLKASLTAARASYDTASRRLAELRGSRGARTEWLRVADPGIVPQRPSSPNVPLILIGATSLALFGSLLYLTMSFSLTRGRRRYDPPLRMASHGAD
jgi:tyrosine-protein kinase Etk/Wzc